MLWKSPYSEDDTIQLNTDTTHRPYKDFVQIVDIFDGQRLVEGEAIRYIPNLETGTITEVTMRKPVPLRKLPDVPLEDCRPQIDDIWVAFAMVAGPTWARWMRSAFQDANPTIELAEVAMAAMEQVASRYPPFRDAYTRAGSSDVRDWLVDSVGLDVWNFFAATINSNPLANLMCTEAINYVRFSAVFRVQKLIFL